MVGAYESLPAAVAATVPRRAVLRDSWIRHQPPDPSDTSSAPSSPSSTPPMTPRTPLSLKLGELRQKWDAPRPSSVVVTTYSPPGGGGTGGGTSEELQGVSGRVSKAKAFFESAPLYQTEQERKPIPELPTPDDAPPTDTIVSYRVRNPLRESPKPKPRRLRNTISDFPRWQGDHTEGHVVAKVSPSTVSVPTGSTATAAAQHEAKSKSPDVEITHLKPTFIRRRYGTVTGVVSDPAHNIGDVLRSKINQEIEFYVRERANSNSVRQEDNSDVEDDAARGNDDDNDATEGGNAGKIYDVDDNDLHRAWRVVVVSRAEGSSSSIIQPGAPTPSAQEDHHSQVDEELESSPNSVISRDPDAVWNARIASLSQSPIPSCRRDHVTIVDKKTLLPFECLSSSSPEEGHSECQGYSSASEGHVPPPPSSPSLSSSETMIVIPEGDGQVQAAATVAAASVAPRVVAACIKSYHDIPEELFNTLQESSVDPHPPPPTSPSSSPSPTLPPPPPSSPPINKNLFITSVSTSLPTPAPRSDWKTMREGRKALLLLTGEGSDAETEEGSEVDLGGVASTSDYHTSDGRGSSLSGASDDHHRQENNLNNNNNIHRNIIHVKADDVGYYHDSYHHHLSSRDVEEEAEFECYNQDVETPNVLIKNNFRGFCSALLGTPSTSPTPHEYVIPPPTRPPPPPKFRSRSPTPPKTDHHSPNSASLEEELRAAGIYFRRPGSPPRLPSRNRALSPPPRPPSSLKNDRSNSLGEAEAVAAALHVLDASLAGLSDSSGESSPARSHASTVVETRQPQLLQQYSLDSPAVDSTLSCSQISSHSQSSSAEHLLYGAPSPSSSYLSQREVEVSDSASPSSVRVYTSDLNDSDNSSAVDYNYESGLSSTTCSAENSPSVVQSHHHRDGEALGLKGSEGVEGFGRTPLSSSSSSSSTVGRTGEEDGEGGPYPGPHHHHSQREAPTSAMENFNLIEEMYVDTRPVPRSTVSMRAYYPGVHYDSSSTSSTSSPKSSLKPPPPPPPPKHPSSSSRYPERGTSLDSTQTLPADSDSGHESGATSPCGTLILDDTQSPPPSPPNNHTLKTQSMHPSLSHSRTSSLQSCRGAGVLEGEVGVAVVGDPTHADVGVGGMALEPRPPTHFVVVAIDFGTTYSGYAFSFTRDPDSIHMMKKWEGGDPGVQNQKTPTIVLLTPDEEFHSLGFIARDTYHDLDPKDAKKWLYFDKFKMALHADETLSRDTLLEAANGRKVPALKIFSYALKYFRDHALKELSDQAGVEVLEEDVRWVITVPAIWSHPAKQFMRTAAYQAGMGSSSRPEQLLIALEPEAAAIYCRRLRRHQLLPERPPELRPPRHSILKEPTSPSDSTSVPALPELDREELVSLPYRSVETVADWLRGDTVYAVVDCGGGTVDITVHQMTDKATGHLKELHKASGGPHGSTGVDGEFQRLLETIFGADFIQTFRQQRPAAYVDLMIAFESRKRNASPYRSNPLNIALPFSFIDLFRKFRGKDVEWAMKKHQNLGVKWSAQGMLRVEQETMRHLFMPTLNSITQAIEAVLSAPEVGHLQYMFLVGGFAESELLQKHIRDTFGHRVNVIIPQGMGLAILRGAVQFGLDPGVVTVRRSRLTYGVGVLNRYQRGTHPADKRVVAAGSEWCADVLDRFVVVDESIAVGDVVVRPYTPATPGQSTVILHLYATHRHDAKFVTEEGVNRVGTLHLELGPPKDNAGSTKSGRREISVHMKFGDTEVKASAVDHLTGQIVRANIDFLAL